MAAVLLRGIFINSLILLPPLLVAALVLSFVYGWMNFPPADLLVAGKAGCEVQKVFLTPWAFVVAIGWVLLFPVLTMLTKIAGYQKSLASGSDSSVESRDRYERTFAIALLLVLGTALFELLPHVVCYYHQARVRYAHGVPWKEYLAAATVAMGSLSAAPKLLKVLSGAWQKVAVALIGFGGVLAPLLIIVVVSDFLVFDKKADLVADFMADLANLEYLLLLLAVTPAIFALGIVIAMVTGVFTGTFSGREYRR